MAETPAHDAAADDAAADAAVTADAAAVLRVSLLATLWTPWSLRLAVTFGLPDLIAGGVTDVTRLAERSGTHAESLGRVLRHLANLGIVAETGPGQVELTELGQVLRSDHPARVAGFLDQDNAFTRSGDQVIPGLLHSVRTGDPAWLEVFGRSFWDDLEAKPDLAAAFDRTMSVHGGNLGPRIAAAYDWSGVRHLVDVGGGTGKVLADVLRAHGHLQGTLVDLPGTVSRAAETFGNAGVADRAQVSGQSFFDELPDAGDVYLLTHVIHNWSDEESVRILRRGAEAAGPDGRVLIVDQIVPETAAAPVAATAAAPDAPDQDTGHGASGARSFATQRDLSMLVVLGSKERTEEEFRRLGVAAGLELSSTSPVVDGGFFVIAFLVKG
jgi:2,7-dihydroxy-5-methyl-1-naphthoate 7-O-methyltransferase